MKTFLILVVVTTSLTSFAAPISLDEAFSHALKKNEAPAIESSRTEQAEERVNQAVGSILPTVSLNGNYTRQHTPSSITNPAARDVQYAGRITLVQPIFKGLSEFAALRNLKARSRSQKALEIQTRLSLYAETAQAYFNVLAAEKDFTDVKVLLDLTAKRLKELRDRTKIGRSRKGDLLSAQAQTASLNVQLETASLEKQQAREQFRYVTGLSAESELSDSSDSLLKGVPALDVYLKMIEKRPDIESLREELVAADEAVSAAFGSHLPTIDLTANYHLFRTGFLADTKWDVGVLFTVPIFQGGIVQSKVRESAEVRKTSELELARARRNAEREIRSFFQAYKSLASQYSAYEEALKLAEANYKEQSKDYRYGLVNNLEVISALNALQETRRSFNRTYYQGKTAFISLQAASGQMPTVTEQKEKR